MSRVTIEDYKELMQRLEVSRLACVGSLSQELEAEFAQGLDDIYWQLTPEEREELEKLYYVR